MHEDVVERDVRRTGHVGKLSPLGLGIELGAADLDPVEGQVADIGNREAGKVCAPCHVGLQRHIRREVPVGDNDIAIVSGSKNDRFAADCIGERCGKLGRVRNLDNRHLDPRGWRNTTIVSAISGITLCRAAYAAVSVGG
ncbi:hypothetical protein GVO57_03870 [Sphingomonas changnyeongensis]|uniref:Uncharacterized protein n=1 Tax=Sphingomonas changnyeongensis TaxID=2698679 RepID=A0A7Z2NVE3_9SPHN|nr:hypothetical protein [Sphingomonas changnyeongensis]QHL90129.1 hypothetical protein GVO57_03870 [Sphingomonas changnyeongensis]